MKYFFVLFTFSIIFLLSVNADDYQEQHCSDISKNMQDGDSIPASCKEIFQASNFFKQASSDQQNLGVWVKNNMLFLVLEKMKKGKLVAIEKFIGGQELSKGKIIDFDISSTPVFSNTFEITLLIKTKTQYRVITHLSSQKNGQKPRVAYFPLLNMKSNIESIHRGQNGRLWFVTDDKQVYHIKSSANSLSSNTKDHPQLTKFIINLSFKPYFIKSNSKEIILLGKEKLIHIRNGNEIKYIIKNGASVEKLEIKDLELQDNNLVVIKTDQQKQNLSLQTAAE